MAFSLTCTGIAQANGKVYVRWSDGVEQEFNSIQHAKDFVIDTLDKDTLRAIAIAKAMKQANPGVYLTGKTITGDLDAVANLVRIA